MEYNHISRREQIFSETLNSQARERGFHGWEEMKQGITFYIGNFIEECLRKALSQVNWQGTL